MKTFSIHALAIVFLFFAYAPFAHAATWRVMALDPQHLVVQCDRFDDESAAFRLTAAERALAIARPNRAFERAVRRVVKTRKDFEASLFSTAWTIEGIPAAACGFWKIPNGLLRLPFPDGSIRPTTEARILWCVFLRLEKPLPPGREIFIELPGVAKIGFKFDPDEPSALFKVNQVGYAASASHRYAYFGSWLGTLGAYRAPVGAQFELIETDSGKPVLTGLLVHRMDDPVRNGIPFCGEETCEMDISDAPPGRYFLRIPGIGRSMDFEIGNNGDAAAFALHMAGLFHQRCGCEKPSQLTPWASPSCHDTVFLGANPPNRPEYDSCFQDMHGRKVRTTPFSVISASIGQWQEKSRAEGGWHDAADYDRRPEHLGLVGDLAAVYLLRPDNFRDSQLIVPERGNGIPDILDEAFWGLKHLLENQRSDGGVGTWIEGERHPDENDRVMPHDDPVRYCLSRATRASSMEYAAHAAILARAMEKAGTAQSIEKATILKRSAIAAWKYATSAKPAQFVAMKAKIGGKARDVFYAESADPPPVRFTVKAAINLYSTTLDATYAKALDGLDDRFRADISKNGWRLSPLVFAETDFTEVPGEAFAKIRAFWKKRTIEEAEKWLRLQESTFPYRLPWFEPSSGKTENTSWGAIHPLRQALSFVAAHAITGDRKFIDAAHLANDYHEGCNPNGTTWTSGLGRISPASFLSLVSCADGIAEYVPGITPYRLVFGIPHTVKTKVWPSEEKKADLQPILRRWPNMERETVNASEFTVWETIGPAAAATGYMMEPGQPVATPLPSPARDIRDLPGFWALP